MENVAYLEIQDIDQHGNLKQYVTQGKPVVLMAQSNHCGYCKQAKPAFQQFADNVNGNVVASSIQIDGESSEQEASKFLNKWDSNYRGVPTYFGFNKDGVFVKTHEGGRDTSSLINFASGL